MRLRGLTLAAVAVLLIIAFVATTGGCGPSAPATPTETYKARLATSWNPGQPGEIQLNNFADIVNKKTNGAMQIQVFPSGQLYGSKDWMDAASAGSVEFGASFMSTLPRYLREMGVSEMPFLFENEQEDKDFYQNNPIMKNVVALFEKQTGVKVLGYVVNGLSTIWSVPELKSVDDINGMDARVTGPNLVQLFKGLGAKVVTLPSEEVYVALQSGMVKVYVSTIHGPFAFSYTDFSHYMYLPNCSVSTGALVVNQKYYDSLPASIQQELPKAAEEMFDEGLKQIRDIEAGWKQKIVNDLKGKVIQWSDADMAKLKQITLDSILPAEAAEYKSEYGPALIAELEKRVKSR